LTRAEGFDEAQARTIVSEHGNGVPAEALDRIFEPFFRVTEAREHQTGGTGLGLSIAQRIALNYGGTIRARNRADGGLEMEIRLPANNVADQTSLNKAIQKGTS